MASDTLRKNLFRKDRKCHWCGRATWLAHGTRLAGMTKHQLATIDHIKCRVEATSHAEYIARGNKVLACYLCNQQRNDAFMAANPNSRCTWAVPPPTERELQARQRSREERNAKKAARKSLVEAKLNHLGVIQLTRATFDQHYP